MTGWDAVFEHSGETEYVGHVYRWLDAHAVDDRFLDVLIEACGNGFSRAVTLRTMGDVVTYDHERRRCRHGRA